MGDSEVDFDKMYAEERKDLKYDFKEKKPEIQKQFKDFWSRPYAKEDVDAYYNKLGLIEKKDAGAHSNSVIEKEDADAHSEGRREGPANSVPYHYNKGGNLEGNWVKSSTAFTGYADDPKNVDNIFVSNKDVLIVGNFASFDIAQYPGNSSPAGMSAVHLLGLTRERIYNGVSLPKEKIHLLNDIKELFAESWTGNEEGHELAKKHYKELEEEIHRLKVENFKFGLHLFPDHSVGHFHMHIVAMTPEMRQWSTSKHDMKTKDVDEVREAIQTFDRNTKTFRRVQGSNDYGVI
ncbi:hypothetical protein PG991_011224 [Apiospora marii]|uniref:HIT domain-containing protein n=1 Tax=Apiospora marii TaxID=335849 RepID=A0ABR1REL8_9PEZI